MKIISHRGASGLGPENSLRSIKIARNLGVHAIEVDLRTTKDNKIVVFHDANLRRLARKNIKVESLTLQQLLNIKLANGEYIPTLDQALEMAGDTPLVLDVKDKNWATILAKALNNYSHKSKLIVASFNYSELLEFQKKCPDIKTYALGVNSLSTIKAAKEFKFSGIAIYYLGINPLTYWLANHNKLEIYVWTVNNRLFARILNKMYPKVSIATDMPHKLQNLVKSIGK